MMQSILNVRVNTYKRRTFRKRKHYGMEKLTYRFSNIYIYMYIYVKGINQISNVLNQKDKTRRHI